MPQLLCLHRVEINTVQTLKYAYLATKKKKSVSIPLGTRKTVLIDHYN
jgi:hypothetical protein